MAQRRGGPQRARPIRAVTPSGVVTYEAGDTRHLGNVPRQDLQALAGRIGAHPNPKWDNPTLRAAILSAAGTSGWTASGGAIPAPKPEAPKPEDRTKLVCPNGHSVTVPTSSVPYYRGKGCPQCGREYVDTDALPEPEAAPKPNGKPNYLPDVLAAIKKIQDSEPTHEMFPALVSALASGRHVYMSGPPGTGKSELAAQAARALGRGFFPFSCDPAMPRSALFGYQDQAGRYLRTPLRDAVETGGVFLLDEMDNGNSSLIAALNSLLSNGHLTFPDAIVEKHPDFILVGTANTWGTGPTAKFVGRNGLDAATLDRTVKLGVGLDPKLEERLAESIDASHGPTVLAAVRKLRKNVEAARIDLLVSPRTTINSTALVAAGWTLRDALVSTALASVEPEQQSALLTGVV